MDDLIDTADIAELLDCSRVHVTNRVTKRPDFPAPKVNLSQRHRRWSKGAVLDWLQKQSEKVPA